MTLATRFVDGLIGLLVRLLCHVDAEDLAKVPRHGPLILATNHVNNLEILVLRSRLRDRRVIGLAKSESWDKPILGWLLDRWEAIPIRRGETDVAALRRALSALKEGRILGVAPEGTRSGHGRLQRGRPGIVTLARKSGAPLLPLVFHGGETLRRNLRRLRRTPFHVRVGEPFVVRSVRAPLTSDIRQRIADEIMYRLAELLPPAYRGEYEGPPPDEEFLGPVPVA